METSKDQFEIETLQKMSQKELETQILSIGDNAHDVKLFLGKLVLDKIVEANMSCKACNTLGELNHAEAGSTFGDESLEKAKMAAYYYQISADQGDVVGANWIGVFYHEGFGVEKDLKKAVEYLEVAARQGNGQSMYQLYLIHNTTDIQKAYGYLIKAIQHGVTHFDEAIKFFEQNYDQLALEYIQKTKLQMDTKNDRKLVIDMYAASINDLRTTFSQALEQDRSFQRPVGFMQDQQIWMFGIQLHYFLNSVLRMDHQDFMIALTTDLDPVLGNVGLWSLKSLLYDAKDSGDKEQRKKIQTAIDIIQNYMDHGISILQQEKKYKHLNKFGPWKFPDEQVKRDEIVHLYSWKDYATEEWFAHVKKIQENLKNQQKLEAKQALKDAVRALREQKIQENENLN